MKKHDAANYLKLSEPFESADKAESAWAAFAEEVWAAREKHGIPDCAIVTAMNVRYEDGYVGMSMSYAHLGDTAKTIMLLAWAVGQEQAARREMIAKLLAGKGK